MDVRCERCQTEYELDDASIPEAGVHVQCTTCGYTFLVKRSAENGRTRTERLIGMGAPPDADPSLPVTRDDLPVAPAPAPWILETEDGRVHRLRDMTTLQKWVVERRVTASDRLSRDGGGAWRALGNVDELVPFFAVVAEADRAKTGTSAAASSAPTQVFRAAGAPSLSEGARGRGGPPRPPADSFGPGHGALGGRAAAAGLPSAGGLSPVEGGADHRLPVFEESGPASLDGPASIDFDDSDVLRPRRRGPVALALILLIGGAVGGGYYLFGHKLSGLPGTKKTEEVAPTAEAVPPPAPTSPLPTTTAPPAAPAPPPVAAPAGAIPAPASAPTAEGRGAGSGQAPGAPPPPGAGVVEAAPGSAAGETPAGGKSAPASRGAAYDRLVAEGDKLLENGQTNRAERLYMQALTAKPDGVGAITGTGYVFLDRGHTQKAMETFLRALALDPRHGPAIFGLAEAYRAQGDPATALNTYRRYLTVSPNGTDAPAARRQVHDLEAANRGSSPNADETP
jgi:predicted Zn finger-like uncharacterized protein